MYAIGNGRLTISSFIVKEVSQFYNTYLHILLQDRKCNEIWISLNVVKYLWITQSPFSQKSRKRVRFKRKVWGGWRGGGGEMGSKDLITVSDCLRYRPTYCYTFELFISFLLLRKVLCLIFIKYFAKWALQISLICFGFVLT